MRLVYVILLACAQTTAGGAVAAPCECRLTDDDVYDCTVSAPLNSSSPLYGSLNRALQAATSDVTSARRIAVTCTDRYDVRIEPGLLGYYQQLDVLTIATCRLEYLPQLVTANCDKYVYRALSALEVTDTGISRIAPSAFCGLYNLARLRLVYNELTTLTKDMLDGLGPSMSSLDLASNFIDSLESNVFADLTNLEELHLEGNRLREVSAELFAPFADRLKLLTLDYNELRTPAEGAFKGMRNLEKLQLGSNPLSELPTDIFADLGNLDFLSIDNITMTTLDPRLIAPLTRLTTLYVAWNQITDVVAFMDNMTAYASARPLDSAVDVVCSGNPFYCDCELVTSDGALVAAFQRQADVSAKMRYHELNCHEPFYSDYALSNLAIYPDEFDKMRSDVLRLNDCYERNFTSCSLATDRNGTKGAVLYCDFLGITELREFAADWAEIAEYNVAAIFLDGNFLDDFNLSDTGLNLEKPLTILSLSQNNIDEGGLSLKEILTHGVTYLGLTENNLTQLPDKDFMLANSLASLDVQVISLNGNPFRCDCETSYLKRWFSNNAQRINKPNETFCTSGPLIEQWEIYRRTAIADLPDDVFTCDSATEVADGRRRRPGRPDVPLRVSIAARRAARPAGRCRRRRRVRLPQTRRRRRRRRKRDGQGVRRLHRLQQSGL
ncbi:PREDICTED: slit homolog 3 protein-like [Priapulus caudatus]|uniref:Slit homolog 3 protein-like n=1 Tax=Priapulus caudatus TaxID=37621 RepID=A0ABM1EI42_PRICU|nr:PREDICTED: slit homolog 3 protein-like [Priapulus caudatus]XP_014671864.1 PREDICTED: slit homolog 3 protein-like [Priapulus caudatus]